MPVGVMSATCRGCAQPVLLAAVDPQGPMRGPELCSRCQQQPVAVTVDSGVPMGLFVEPDRYGTGDLFGGQL